MAAAMPPSIAFLLGLVVFMAAYVTAQAVGAVPEPLLQVVEVVR